MILIEKTEVMGWEAAIRGMRNPMNSWDKSDTMFIHDGRFRTVDGDSGIYYGNNDDIEIGPNDLDLMLRLAKAGSVDGKFRRMIAVYVDITAPLYWWKEFDTYKVGTVANSCSTMHKIHAKEFTLDDFSHEHLIGFWETPLRETIEMLNKTRELYAESGNKDKELWYRMIQLLPSSYNQKRTVMLNYEVLANIYQHRRNHKLDEWRTLCQWSELLPYSEIITCGTDGGKAT